MAVSTGWSVPLQNQATITSGRKSGSARKRIIYMDQFCRIEASGGKALTLYTDIDRLESHMKEIAPEDSAFIAELTGASDALPKWKCRLIKLSSFTEEWTI